MGKFFKQRCEMLRQLTQHAVEQRGNKRRKALSQKGNGNFLFEISEKKSNLLRQAHLNEISLKRLPAQ